MARKTPDTGTAPDPAETARAEVERLNSQELAIAVLYRQKSDELAGVHAQRGDRVLDADDLGDAARESGHRVNALREELEALADAAKRARERRLAAIPAAFEAEARAKEREADELETKATRCQRTGFHAAPPGRAISADRGGAAPREDARPGGDDRGRHGRRADRSRA